MTTPGDPRTGRKWQEFARWILDQHRDPITGVVRCWRCGRPGADTAGHVLPVKTHPRLALDPGNVRPEHGEKRTIERDGFDCIGNYAAGADAGQIGEEPTLHAPRRDWLADS